jgi:hypothetical protein
LVLHILSTSRRKTFEICRLSAERHGRGDERGPGSLSGRDGLKVSLEIGRIRRPGRKTKRGSAGPVFSGLRFFMVGEADSNPRFWQTGSLTRHRVRLFPVASRKDRRVSGNRTSALWHFTVDRAIQERKLSHPGGALSIYVAWYNSCRVRSALRVSATTEARITDRIWEIQDLQPR